MIKEFMFDFAVITCILFSSGVSVGLAVEAVNSILYMAKKSE